MSPTVTRMPDGGLRITSMVGPPPSKGGPARQGYEKLMLPGIEVGLQGWEKSHSQGAITGNESAAGIVYAPKEVNQGLQRLGIERFIADLYAEKRTGVGIEMTTVTYTWPGTRRLKEIHYVVKVVEGGSKTALYEAWLTVSNDKTNPKVGFGIEKRANELLEQFLRPPIKRTVQRKQRAKRNAGVSAARESKATSKPPQSAAVPSTMPRTKAYVGVPDKRPIPTAGPSARGTAIAGGIDLLLQLAHFGLDVFGDHLAKSDAEEAWAKKRPEVDRHLTGHPTDGALVVSCFRGRRLQRIDLEYAVSEGTARQKYASRSFIENVDSRAYTWFPPIQDVPWRNLPTPFPKFALARFQAGREGLIRVAFTGDDEAPFDDAGRRVGMKNPDGVEVQFLVLSPPAWMGWRNGSGRWVEATVPLVTSSSASGELLSAVDLDSGFWDIGEAVGVPVFPVNEAAKAVFPRFRTWGVTGSLRHQYTDIDSIAWAWPGDIQILEKV